MCGGGYSPPKICAFKLSKGINDIRLLCCQVLPVSFSKKNHVTNASHTNQTCYSRLLLPEQLF